MARQAVGRTARAIFDVADAKGSAAQVADDFTALAALVEEHRELHRSLTNPMVPAAAKGRVLDALSHTLAWTPITRQVLAVLADRDELSQLPGLTRALRARVMEHQRIVEAEVTTAVALDNGQAAVLAQSLSDATGREVRLTRRIDPTILGGAVARVGSVVFDGSVTAQLARFKRQIVEQG
jgi:F-type H+-transporting ATPase subunit delta